MQACGLYYMSKSLCTPETISLSSSSLLLCLASHWMLERLCEDLCWFSLLGCRGASTSTSSQRFSVGGGEVRGPCRSSFAPTLTHTMSLRRCLLCAQAYCHAGTVVSSPSSCTEKLFKSYGDILYYCMDFKGRRLLLKMLYKQRKESNLLL